MNWTVLVYKEGDYFSIGTADEEVVTAMLKREQEPGVDNDLVTHTIETSQETNCMIPMFNKAIMLVPINTIKTDELTGIACCELALRAVPPDEDQADEEDYSEEDYSDDDDLFDDEDDYSDDYEDDHDVDLAMWRDHDYLD